MPLPLDSISTDQRLVFMITRVQQIVDILNMSIVPIKVANTVTADSGTGASGGFDWNIAWTL